MKKNIALVALIVAAIAPQLAFADDAESPWLVRLRAVQINPANGSDAVGGVGAPNRISISSKTIPEGDISYFFTPNWAAELVLTYPQTHTVYLDGGSIGTFKQLPPTLLMQYHFMPQETFSPYVGVGLNYTRISNVSLASGMTLQSNSIGAALQAGLDIKLDRHWSLNVDVKKVQMGSDVYAASGAKVSSVQIDPWLIGAGVGYRF
ncbi:OmpW family outer membrane protein [Herbaspirillum sp. RTI4]|uniref:OmpW/AlkL family protein n=1 Tax=Herbaspirillum sp. RTI4 TaxID=3048640 RepID=UPI002AB4C398|nr:OmpW family outer membrane protein [Herbaspirillum sp. RTI4]MDY7578993.1 OmpW family outer membrane protein [Herbaspirillum sp. RTI4]MEA9980924.1 OmpW family outer membrane protein [Herbaspirillum sp. RTI4]